MRHVAITGGPGAGKTTLLVELARRGFATVAESARAIILERLALGQAPRPDSKTFAHEILRRDKQNYESLPLSAGWVFYDRGAIEGIAMVHEASPFHVAELDHLLVTYQFHRTVFVLPPWQAIYLTDTERDHTFEHATRVHSQVVKWYRSCGYQLNEVPRLPVEERADHVLQVISAASDA